MAQEEKIFPKGFIFKAPRERAPDFVKGSISIKVDEFIAFLQEHSKNGWVNINLKEARGGKFYSELDTWVPKARDESEPSHAGPDSGEEINAEDIPY